MHLKHVVYEDYINYKKPSMFICTATCRGKCCAEAGLPLSMCQNDEWRSRATVVMDDAELCRRYLANELTSAVVFGGLEPFEQMAELLDFAKTLREDFACDDDIVIYTGYYPGEIQVELSRLCCYKNIVVKFGRYIPGSEERYDNVLGVVLSSENQFAERVS